jgi:hypothetical protein
MRKQSDALRTYATAPTHEQRGGPGSAGQSGDTQGLPDIAEAGSESVMELLEEGQYFEAEVLLGVELAREPDVEEVQSRELPARSGNPDSEPSAEPSVEPAPKPKRRHPSPR